MKATKALRITALLMTGVFATVAPGGAPMGPPTARLGEGNWAIGADLGLEQMDLRSCGTFHITYLDPLIAGDFDFVESQRIQDVEMTMIFGNLAYGVCDNWDLFVRVGAADMQDDARATADLDFGTPEEYSLGTLDSSFGLAWGVGTRATFCRSGPWAFGGLVQVTWFEPQDSDVDYIDPLFVDPAVVHAGEASIDFWQTQISLAVAYQVDTLSLWAGPFLQFVEGDIDRSGDILFDGFADGSFRASSEIEEESQFGAHFGAGWEVSNQWNLWVEGQITGDSWLIGVGTFFTTEETFGL